jgi:hypothetical protein
VDEDEERLRPLRPVPRRRRARSLLGNSHIVGVPAAPASETRRR